MIENTTSLFTVPMQHILLVISKQKLCVYTYNLGPKA